MCEKNTPCRLVENSLLYLAQTNKKWVVDLVKRGFMQENLWQAVLGEIELSVSRANFITWFQKTALVRYKDNIMTIGVTNVFVKQQMEQKFSQLIEEVLNKNGVKPKVIEYKIHSGIAAKEKPSEEVAVLQRPAATQGLPSAQSAARRQGLNERYNFENFIVGSGNELAYAACQAIAQSPGEKYNPLFVYGGVGIGKTHLIQAVGNAILAKYPSAKVVYISTEQFVREFLETVRFKKNTEFAKFYRSADVLIIDDLQFIAGKEKTQDEFFHTFNALIQANKQIIMSSDKPPSDIPTLEDRLRSRLASGMSIDMQAPDFETRCAIIQTKAEARGFKIDTEVMEYLATNVRSNVRELEGVLNQLLAHCEVKGLQADVELAKSLLGSARSRPKHLSSKQVIERTARHFHISIDEILGPKRDKDIVVPRQVAMYMLRNELHLSFPKIARELGRKDHTTAIHSVEKIEKESSFDTNLKGAINEIRERLYA